MPRTTDLVEVRRILETDRIWAAYALADLEPEEAEHCIWLRGDLEPSAIALVYQAFDAPVLLYVGKSEQITSLLPEIDEAIGNARELTLVARPNAFALLGQHFEIVKSSRMHRMALNPVQSVPFCESLASRVRIEHLDALQRLYADGDATGEAPEFFTPSMLKRGVYFGVWNGDSLVAAAGTHIVAKSASVAAIGNVYTRRDSRRRGLAAMVTHSVTLELRRQKLSTIVLNVWSQNTGAVDLYKRLGYRRHCDFFEAVAGTYEG